MSLQEHLYTETTINNVLEKYIKELTALDNVEDLLHANKLKAYKNFINDKAFIRSLRRLFNEIYDFMDKKYPELYFSIAGRRKSLISTERKILQYAELGQSTDLIRDFFAFRIILFGDESLNLISYCYKVIEEIIDFAASKGYMPCEGLPLIGDVNESNLLPNMNFKYDHLVKDYIRFPKTNGYQSIHLVLVDSNNRHIEVQVRTLPMHAKIESTEANHALYKQTKYDIYFPLDRDNINIIGYNYSNEQVFDLAGVEQAPSIFKRQKII